MEKDYIDLISRINALIEDKKILIERNEANIKDAKIIIEKLENAIGRIQPH